MRRFFYCTSILSLICSSSALADMARGKELYAQRCASCHGPEGKGDGPVAAALDASQRPRNLVTDAKKFATDSAKLKLLLKTGGASNGLSPLMPPQPDLPDSDIDSLVEVVNSLAKK